MIGAPKIHHSFSSFSSLFCPLSSAWNVDVIAGSLPVMVDRESKGHPLDGTMGSLDQRSLRQIRPYQPIKATSRQSALFLVVES